MKELVTDIFVRIYNEKICPKYMEWKSESVLSFPYFCRVSWGVRLRGFAHQKQ